MPGLNKAIAKLDAQFAALKLKRRKVIAEVQARCKHRQQAECDYQPLHFDGSLPPMRICCNCGMTEVGWGCGYIVLRGPATTIERNTLYAQRRGLAIGNEHKGPLLRREVTEAELIERLTP